MRSLCSQQDGGPTPLKVLMVPYTHIPTIIDCPFVRQRVGPTIGVLSNSLRRSAPILPPGPALGRSSLCFPQLSQLHRLNRRLGDCLFQFDSVRGLKCVLGL